MLDMSAHKLLTDVSAIDGPSSILKTNTGARDYEPTFAEMKFTDKLNFRNALHHNILMEQ